MTTYDSPRLHGLDTLRAIAIVAVMIFHLEGFLPDALKPVADVGWMGVDLFFVLSGYLIGLQLLKPYRRGVRLDAREFYVRRAFRILPAYLAVVLLYVTVPVWRENPNLPAVWKLLTFTANLFMNFPLERAFSHVWSLCIEEHFYLVLPVLVIGCMRRPSLARTLGLLGSTVLFGILIRRWELLHVVEAPGLDDDAAGALFMKRIYYPTYARLDGLVMGVAVALLQVFRRGWWERMARHPNVAMLAGLLISAVAVWMFRGDFPSSDDGIGVIYGFPLLSAGFALLVLSAAAGAGLASVRVPGARLLATLAFSLYLTHKEVAHVLRVLFPVLKDAHGWGAAAAYAAGCLLVAGLLYAGVERPFLVLRDRHPGWGSRGEADVQARVDPAL